ncbi:hypothetical protein ACN9MJ_13045 [Acidovorax facilis]|uniref:hypothetical protein n=1 Tax=Acidovorax facilis TaxID=12917 RepID=UPI003CF889CC
MGQITLAYHGCDITTRDDLVTGLIRNLRSSTNEYDWLGDGSYYFENDSTRALQYAKYTANHPTLNLTKVPIGTPAVVGVVLDVSRWLDMTTQEGIDNYRIALRTLLTGFAATGKPPPANTAAFSGDADLIHRSLDRAVYELIHSLRATELANGMAEGDASKVVDMAPYQATRGAFKQGLQVGATSSVHEGNHVQIALRDVNCVRGWFLVPGDKLMDSAERTLADEKKAVAKTAATKAKRRVRPPLKS